MFISILFIGNVAMAQHPKLEKNGKYKQKKSKVADHHQSTEKKKSHHKADWKTHSQSENESFSKKKRKKN
jgi:hypothetical protein